MTTPAEEWHFDTARVGRRVLVFDELESTNTFAATLASPEDGLAIIARNQTSGRGRFGRVWQSRPGSSLLLSVVLHPPAELRRASVLTATAAVALGDAVLHLTGRQARVKWPNDLLVRGKKVCGILIEQGRAVVIGVGLNLNQTADEFLGLELPEAISLRELVVQAQPLQRPGLGSREQFDLRVTAEVVLKRLDAEFARLLCGERVAVEADWKWRTGLLGRQVEVELIDGGIVRGRMREMNFDGLEVDCLDGKRRTITPETVAHVRLAEPSAPTAAGGLSEML